MYLDHMRFRLIIMLGLLAGSGLWADTDSLILPRPNQLIIDNFARLRFPETIRGREVGRVVFRVRYARLATNKLGYAQADTVAAVDSVPPFETIFDLTGAPDQDNRNLMFHYSAYDRQGRVIRDGRDDPLPRDFYRFAVLDRKRQPAAAREWRCPPAAYPVTVDGDLAEWTWTDTVFFTHNDNRITAAACRDDSCLYIGVRVTDGSVVGIFDTVRLWLMDGIEVMLDPLFRRRHHRTLAEPQLMVPVSGYIRYAPFPVGAEEVRLHLVRDTVIPPAAVMRTGTGYQAEMAFTWSWLGISPAVGTGLGINLVNSDLDQPDGVVMTASWAGISDLEHHNPAQWGTMRLTRQSVPVRVIVLVTLLLVIPVLAVIRRIRKKNPVPLREEPAEPVATPQQRTVTQVQAYLAAHYTDADLSLQHIADEVRMSPEYLRQVYKTETGQSISDAINDLRLAEACRLLSQTDKPVSDIPFEAGFGSYHNFHRVLKSATGLGPKEYRETHRQAGTG